VNILKCGSYPEGTHDHSTTRLTRQTHEPSEVSIVPVSPRGGLAIRFFRLREGEHGRNASWDHGLHSFRFFHAPIPKGRTKRIRLTACQGP
jgi:hypothetical protein